MTEPIYIAQNAECKTNQEVFDWFAARAQDAKNAGAKLIRYTRDENNPFLLLVEGWDDERANQGSPNWQLVSV